MQPVTALNTLASNGFLPAGRSALRLVFGASLLAALAACSLPFGLGTPTERALETGVQGSLGSSSFELAGTYTGPGVAVPSHSSGARSNPASSSTTWSIDLQTAGSGKQHVTVNGTNLKVEAIIIDGSAYFSGQQFLADNMGEDPLSRGLVAAAGNAWWKGAAGLVPQLPEFTNATSFKSTFLGAAVTQRADNFSVDGVDAVKLSGPRADVYIASASPYQLLALQMKKGVVIDGVGDALFKYSSYNKDFGIKAPTDVIDFSNLSSLPPIYTVVSVDTSRCSSPCAVSAQLKNLGGMVGAKGPSTITFTMTGTVSGTVLGTCQAQVVPDVGYNATTTVGCTINLSSTPPNAANVTATPDNPGRG
jgi:hypothetical protein